MGGVVELNAVVVIAVHRGSPAIVSAHNSVSELMTVANKAAVVVGRFGPVGALHLLGIKTIDTARVAQHTLANRLAVSQLLRINAHEPPPIALPRDPWSRSCRKSYRSRRSAGR